MTDAAVTAEPLVLTERLSPRIVEVVLNRPQRRNALIGPLADQLAATIERLNQDPETSVILLRGAGGAFCSGLDLKEFGADPQPEWVASFGRSWRRVHEALFDSQCIVVGALERAAVNGGAALALACDFLIAGDESFLQVGEIQQGMAAPMNMSWLRLRFSEALAGRIALLGDRLDGPTLVQMGVAHQSVPDVDVVEAARGLAARLGEHDPTGVARIKTSLRRTVVTESASEWFARASSADPAPQATTRPVAARDT